MDSLQNQRRQPHIGISEATAAAEFFHGVVMHEGAGDDGGGEIVTSSVEADALAKMNRPFKRLADSQAAGGSKENGDNDRQPPFVRCIVLFRTGMLFLRDEFFVCFQFEVFHTHTHSLFLMYLFFYFLLFFLNLFRNLHRNHGHTLNKRVRRRMVLMFRLVVHYKLVNKK